MNNVDRHRFIIEQLQERGGVSVLELCETLNVSSVTIRKDLRLLENKRLLYRTHGGATLNNPYTSDRAVSEKEKLQFSEKTAIAKRAAELVAPDDSIIIASGTSVQAMARELKPVGHVTVVTSSLHVALQLMNHDNVEILQLGGVIRKTSGSVAGIYSERVLADFFCSKFFIGVDGIDLDIGLTTTNVLEAELNRNMIRSAQKTIVLADSSKFGKRGFGRICKLHEVDEIITDSGIAPAMRKSIEKEGVIVTVV